MQKEANMKTPAEMLYKLLINGGRIEHDGTVFAMDTAGSLCAIMHNCSSGKEVPVKVDCDMAGFHKMAEDIGWEYIWTCLCMQAVKLKKGE